MNVGVNSEFSNGSSRQMVLFRVLSTLSRQTETEISMPVYQKEYFKKSFFVTGQKTTCRYGKPNSISSIDILHKG